LRCTRAAASRSECALCDTANFKSFDGLAACLRSSQHVETLPSVLGPTLFLVRHAAALRHALSLDEGDGYGAVQYRAGPDWRAKEQQYPGACYGHATILKVATRLAKHVPHATNRGPPRLFWMSNAATAPIVPHPPDTAEATRVLSEVLVAANASWVLLNPYSSFATSVLRLRLSLKRKTAGAACNSAKFVGIGDRLDSCSCDTQDSHGARAARLGRALCDGEGKHTTGKTPLPPLPHRLQPAGYGHPRRHESKRVPWTHP